MVDKRPTRRKRRAPPKNASGKKVPPKNARTPEEEQPLTAGEEPIGAEALEKAVPARETEPANEPEEPAVSLEALMRVPDFRQRVIRLVVRKLV